MASGEIRAGKAYVELSTRDKISQSLTRVENRLKSVGQTVSSIGAKMAGVGVGVVAAFAPAIKAASDLQETSSKFGVIFGSQAGATQKWSDDFAKAVGRSKKEMMDFLSLAQGSLVNQLGDPKVAAEMSKALTQLAVDLGSFSNVSDADAFAALMSAFRGEADPIEKFGVNVKEAAVNAELLNQKLDPKNATEAQKAMARFAIIMRQTKAAQGDAIRTADGFANSMKRLKGEAVDAAAELGSQVLPIATKFISKVTEMVTAVSAWAAQNKQTIKQYGELALIMGASAVAVGAVLIVTGKLIAIGATLITVIKGVSAALVFLAANPVVLLAAGIATLVGGSIALVAAFQKLASAKIDDPMYQQAAAMQAAQAEAKNLLDRLEALSAKTKLSSAEQQEAATIIEALTKRYGNLGMSINGATGAIHGFAEAQKKAKDAERDEEIRKTTVALNESKRAIDQYKKQIDAIGGLGDLPVVGLGYTFGGGEGALDTLGKNIDGELKKQAELKIALKQLQGGADPFEVGKAKSSGIGDSEATKRAREAGVAAARQAALGETYTEARKKLSALREEERRTLLSEADQKVAGVNDMLKEQITLVDELARVAKERGDNGDFQRLAAEKVAITKNAEDQIKRIREESTKQASEEATRQQEEAARTAEEQKRAAEEQKGQKRDKRMFFMEQMKELAEKTGNTGRAAELDKLLKREQFESSLQATFGDDEAGKKKARAIQDKIDALPQITQKTTSAGTFNAAAVQSLAGSAFVERTAKATEESAKELKKLNNNRIAFK